MLSFFVTLLAVSSAIATPLQKRTDNTQPAGTNLITTFTSNFLGIQTSANSCSHRDLGFTGSISGKWYAIYGDNLWCAGGITDPDQDTDGFHGMVRDSVSRMTQDPLKPIDLHLNGDTPVPHQLQFVPFNSAWGETSSYGFGGTSLCQTNKTAYEGIIFYLVNANDAGLVGAGVGKVNVIDGTPTVTERYGTTGYWWNVTTNPRYGDVAAYRDTRSHWVYAWGGAPTTQTGYGPAGYVYQTRVLAENAFDLSKYEYWHGRSVGWSTTPLTDFNPETAVMWGTGQGQVYWNAHFNCYMFVHTSTNSVLLRTAPAPEGPWTADVNVYTATTSDMIYAGVAHPYLDSTGKTLVVSYTNMPNHIEVVKITFTA